MPPPKKRIEPKSKQKKQRKQKQKRKPAPGSKQSIEARRERKERAERGEVTQEDALAELSEEWAREDAGEPEPPEQWPYRTSYARLIRTGQAIRAKKRELKPLQKEWEQLQAKLSLIMGEPPSPSDSD